MEMQRNGKNEYRRVEPVSLVRQNLDSKALEGWSIQSDKSKQEQKSINILKGQRSLLPTAVILDPNLCRARIFVLADVLRLNCFLVPFWAF